MGWSKKMIHKKFRPYNVPARTLHDRFGYEQSYFWSLTIHHGLAQTLPLPLRLVMFGLVEVSLLSNYYSVAMVGATRASIGDGLVSLNGTRESTLDFLVPTHKSYTLRHMTK